MGELVIEPRDLMRSLPSRVCPVCGGAKRSWQTMCYGDYRSLPADLRARLYDRFGQGYEEAVQEALRWHGVTTVHLPVEGMA